MDLKITYGPRVWQWVYVSLTDNYALAEDPDDHGIALASLILREVWGDADGNEDKVKMGDIALNSLTIEGVKFDSFPDTTTFEKLIEVCNDLVKLCQMVDRGDAATVLALLDWDEWDCFDFDEKYPSDRVYTSFEESEWEEFGRQEIENWHPDFPNDVYDFVDLEAYGKSRAEGYRVHTFQDRTFLFYH